MSFSYCFGANPTIDYPRFLVGDTVACPHIFEDEEIRMAAVIQSLTWQSSQRYSGGSGNYLPTTPVSYRRVAATLLDGLAANRSRFSPITQLLDVKLDASKVADALRTQAQIYRDEDDAGAFVVIEQVNNDWAYRDRFWRQIQRLNSW
jgi:hypothetical protein